MKSRVLILCSALIFGIYLSKADYPAGYYNTLVGKNKASLKTAAKNLIRSHKAISYGNPTWEAFKKTDVRVVDGKSYWWDMYSNNLVLISSGHGGLNIEHSVANSWWDGANNDAYKDIHHLNPSNAEANNRKGNYPLGIVKTVTYTNGVTIVGKPANASDYGGATMVYEPCDEYKGDFARVFMYMFTCYEDMTWGTRFTWMYNEGEKYPMFRPWAVNLLLDWSRNDPVSEKEINRNEAVYGVQKNRNPFIDLPHLAEYIWGSKQNESFTLEGSGGGEATLTTPVSGAVYDFGNRVQGTPCSLTIPVQGNNLTSALTVSVAGDSQFGVGSTTISASEAMQGTQLQVTYSAQKTGTVSGVVTIGGGGLKQPVAVTLMATGMEKTQLTPVTAYRPEPLESNHYRARWSEAAVTPDYYIVNRTYKVAGELKTRRYMTSEPYYDFNDRDINNDESYTVQYAVGSDVSAPSNVIEVKAGDLAAGEISADTFEVECVAGGVVISCGDANRLAITDISGRVVVETSYAPAGTFIPLSKGLYILSSPKLGGALKIYVP